ncbi:cytoplasmic tRNA 2-thiolation protein 1 [Sporothrix brasiliensis 5110]|uniref:Cytoplasmic tRNA 2-thiolation protein 1 n=1 Tax=Sporothrix brasiliensis 5110 TaxID=1398154 RepID=A0A0C2JBE9_9PEZI|nr:cytoplasmic tRNA 2-thiolation protein 1 [Sporothrix brasiliensis 5110]KIH94187.1 cytoplasmic tRNA 2-thiolation protein 1 [Sporothrix brasiliensis 5110]
MAPALCVLCKTERALIKRPKNHQKLCKTCFIAVFEDEVHHTITSSGLFGPGERVAIGASGGKDSTVLASVLKTLNERHKYGLDLVLLSIDEGIKGYRDDSLETVKRNAVQYDMPLKIVGYDELYGWTMDQVVETIGKKGNCTYCGVFRRQALDRGAKLLEIKHVVTGHNADDVAETVLMNLLRGDLPRLSRSTSIVTGGDRADVDVKRSKPLKYAYEKEIVLYAHHKKLDYFSTECIYSPEAFRGSARSLIKNLERVRPSAILDIVRSGEDMARLVPGAAPIASSCSCSGSAGKAGKTTATASKAAAGAPPLPVDDGTDGGGGAGGCGSQGGRSSGNELAAMEAHLKSNEAAESLETDMASLFLARKQQQLDDGHVPANKTKAAPPPAPTSPAATSTPSQPQGRNAVAKQVLGTCVKCGYMSSQAMCQACTLLEGLNKNRPQIQI